MARYNHFSSHKYQSICFGNLEVGEKFRKDTARRNDIVMVKTGELTYEEFKSKKKYSFPHTAFEVRSHKALL